MPTPQTTAGQLWLAVIHPAVKRWLSDRGFVAGDILAQRPLLDVIRDDAFQRDLHQAMHGAAQLDREPVERLLKGFATLGGVKWTNELQNRARTVSGDVAKIAPYVQKLAPDVWDQLHGSRGSVMTLTQSIAESHRDRMSPEAAGDLAKQLYSRLSAVDPHALRGFSMHDLGAVYKEMRRQGRIGDAATPDEIHKQLLDVVKPVSAVRDALGTNDIHAALDTFRTIPPAAFNYGLDDLESRIRQGDVLGRYGGAFQAAATAAGGMPLGTDMAELAARDAQLRQQAASSSVGNLVAATHRLGQSLGFAPGSPAAQMHQALLSGQIPTINASQWLATMQTSGIDRDTAREFLMQTPANRQVLTPELVDTIRRNQRQTDLQPRIDQRLQTASPANRELLRPGAEAEVATQAGYRDAAEMQALHGPAAQGVRDMFAFGRQQAEAAKQTSGIGMHGPLTRMVDAVQQATPQTSGTDLLRSGLNIIPHSQLPHGPGMPKLGIDEPGPGNPGHEVSLPGHDSDEPNRITPVIKRTRQHTEEYEVCPHCNEEIGEKSIYVDPDNYVYHRPCQDKGPIDCLRRPDEETMRQLYEGWAGRTKQAGGDMLAFQAWKARGLSDEAADYRAGVSLELPGDIPKGEICPHCGERLEYSSEDEKCNHCGKSYSPEKLAEQIHTHTHTRSSGTYDINALIELLAERSPEAVPLVDVTGANRSKRTGFSPKRLLQADATYPGIVDEQNALLDGRHRLLKLLDAGETVGQFHRATPQDLATVKVAVDDRAGVKQLIEKAVAACTTPASEEQAAAGNYKKGHFSVYGIPITIETGKG
jgi:uncharacterized protein (DUF2267 family)